MAKTIPATATEVRVWFNENPKMVPDGDKTVGKAPGDHRGRLSPAAQKVFAENTGKTYVAKHRDDLIEITYSYRQPSGKKAKKTERLSVKEIRSLAGDAAKAKGRLTAAAMEAAREALSARMTKQSKAKAKAPEVVTDAG